MTAEGAGFFGKVTSHGDFVSRRLPPTFIEAWDGWLQQCIQASRERLGAGWLQHYLTSPLWRFALDKGVVDGQAWAGILMPSVDRVGRHFPLMLAAPSQTPAPMLDWLGGATAWYDRLEQLALGSLDAQFVLDDFDAAVAALQAPSADGVATGSGDWRLPMAGLDQTPEQHAALTGSIARSLMAGHSFWWTDGSPSVEGSLLVCRGLPAPASFAAMIDGSWQQSGWRA